MSIPHVLRDRSTISITVPVHRAEFAEADVPFADLIDPLISFRSTSFAKDAAGAIVGRHVRESLGHRNGDIYRFAAKLVPRVVLGLRAAGYDVVASLPIQRILRPDPRALAAATAVVAELFTHPTTWAGRLFVGGRGLSRRDIPEILRLYPAARIVVAARNRTVCQWWADHLRHANLPQRVVTYSDLIRQGWGGVAEGTRHVPQSPRPLYPPGFRPRNRTGRRSGARRDAGAGS